MSDNNWVTIKHAEHLCRCLEVMPGLVWVKDMEGVYLFCNKNFEQLIGSSVEHIVGSTDALFMTDELSQKLSRNDHQVFNDDVQIGYEEEICSANGQKYIFEIEKKAVKSHSGEVIGLLGTGKDITALKQAKLELHEYHNHLEILVNERTEELELMNQELMATNEELYKQKEEMEITIQKLNQTQKQLVQSEKMASLGILSAGIAHEINNPLNFIQGGSLGLRKYFTNKLPEHLDNVSPLLEAISVGVDRATRIVQSLSHYSRHNDVLKSECDIHLIIDNCLMILHNQIKKKAIISKNYSNTRIVVHGNDGQLHQVFMNILSNAVQSITENGDIEISTELVDEGVKVTISDTGCGIEAEHMKKIFDPFFTTKAPGQGTGLGLSITYSIIQEHNGRIEVASSPGNGSSFFIILPLEQNV